MLTVPQGSETSWLYSSSEGRQQIAGSANFKRLIIVSMHRNQEYTDLEAVQSELSPMVMELAPPGMPANQRVNPQKKTSHGITTICSNIHILLCDPTQVPFLTVGGNLGWREEVTRGVSELSGEYCVENVKGEDGELYRRLVFLSNANIIQSECHLISSNTGQLVFLFYKILCFGFWS